MSDEEDWAEEVARWSQADKERAWSEVQVRAKGERKLFYCSIDGKPGAPIWADGKPVPGTGCDGAPHAGYPYRHARADQWPPPGSDWLLWFLLGGRGSGKAVSIDTMVPVPYNRAMIEDTTPVHTANGWARIGDLRIGDQVFDESGHPARVTALFDPEVSDAYRVSFSDGTSIDACGDHLWSTYTMAERKSRNRSRPRGGMERPYPENWASRPGSIRNTRMLFATQKHGANRNHSIPLAAPLAGPEVALLVHPWALGYWLGNGSVKDGSVTTNAADEQYVRGSMLSHGHLCGVDYTRDDGERTAPTFTPRGLMVNLRTIGVLHQKHIPLAYMRASEAQRRALLAGLLDSDGYIDPRKQQIEFSAVHNEKLALQVLELVRSLGEKPVFKESVAKLDGRVTGRRFRITWRPIANPFLSPRKAAVWQPPSGQGSRSHQRMIVSVEPIPVVGRYRCITVDSPNSMFLIGEGMIPTHNTRTGAEYVRQMSKKVKRIALIGATNQAVRDVMVEGDSGLHSVFGNYGEKIDYKPALRRITFPSGAMATLFTGEEPDRLRGPQHGGFWLDEPSHFPFITEVWDQLMFGMRLGTRPHGVCTSTPLPNKWTKERVADPNTRIARVSTYANLANLAPTVKDTILAKFEGTRLGKQELEGELLSDVEGALWSADLLVRSNVDWHDMDRIVVAIDPAGTANRRSDETGIVVVGRMGRFGYVLADYSGKYSPQGWSEKAAWAYRNFHADAIIAEKNFGGDMVKTTIESATKEARIIVTTASRSKQLRAEPIVALYEQKRVFHNDVVLDLEDEMLTWVPGQGESPNRIDAMVHGFTELFDGPGEARIATPPSTTRLPARSAGQRGEPRRALFGRKIA